VLRLSWKLRLTISVFHRAFLAFKARFSGY
jgi:hypothetical protein